MSYRLIDNETNEDIIDKLNRIEDERDKYKEVLDKIKEEIELLGIVDCNIPNYIICISKINELLEKVE